VTSQQVMMMMMMNDLTQIGMTLLGAFYYIDINTLSTVF